MNILILHEVSYLKKPVYEYQDFSERLALHDHSVTVIDFDEESKNRLTHCQVSRTGLAPIQLISLPNIGLSPFKYLFAQIAFIFLLFKLHREKKIDVLFVYSVFINGFLAVIIGKWLGIKVIYRAIDAYHRLRKSPFQSAIIKILEKYIYCNVDQILTTNEQMSRYVYELVSPKIPSLTRVLMHGVDTHHFNKSSQTEGCLTKFGIDSDDFICLFLGTTYHFSQLDLFVKKVDEIRNCIPNFKLLIVGNGELDSIIQANIKQIDNKNCVICTGLIDYLELPKYLSRANAAINPFKINSITQDIIPIKILQYLSMGIATISTPLPDLIKTIPEIEAGIFYSANDSVDAITNKLLEIHESDQLKLGQLHARPYIMDHFSIHNTLIQLEKSFQSC